MSRTKTYIAADWDSDFEVVKKLCEWNESDYYNLHFLDAHKEKQSRDSSKYCSIKKSLKDRMDISKTFVLVVGANTNSITKGSCKYCDRYSSWYEKCLGGYSADFRSYIKYECDKAIEAGIRVVVIYNYANVDKSKCPESVRYIGTHLPFYYYKDGKCYYNYTQIKKAIMGE